MNGSEKTAVKQRAFKNFVKDKSVYIIKAVSSFIIGIL